MFFYRHIVRLAIWHHLFLTFWLVHTWFFTHWRHQRAVTHLKNVRQLNIRRDKKLRFQLSRRQPLEHLRWLPVIKLEPSPLNQQISVPAIFCYKKNSLQWYVLSRSSFPAITKWVVLWNCFLNDLSVKNSSLFINFYKKIIRWQVDVRRHVIRVCLEDL